ncbi:MAG TPA: acetate--CoA ligase, partial [Terriglobales bacterium]|nr:acetate--CoA ligase [Terriglobales bacterium]
MPETQAAQHQDIQSILREGRKFDPPPGFIQQASVKSLAEYRKLYDAAAADPEKFWAGVAGELHWFQKWNKVLEWELPWAKWFVGGKLNLSYNCLDRHVGGPRENKVAIIWEGEPGEVRTLTYRQLLREVSKCANALKSLGIKAGDRVAIYMGMTPELAIALLACARIGAVHSVIFGGFSANALVDRINDAQCIAVITQDTGWRRGNEIKLKATVDEALASCPSVKHVVVYRRTGSQISMKSGRDHWWQEIVEKASDHCPAEALDAEDPLFILYTSGTTGKPKGIVHTTGGYSVGVYYTTKMVFDLHDEDIYWCTADIGWVTGHSYIVYGPLQNGATALMYEGAPNHPDFDRFWQMIDRHKVSIFYTAPTAIRAFIKWGSEYPKRHQLDSLRLLGTVGEPINPEAWMWYREVIGKNRCPIVDTWWQTETGMIMISPIPGAVATKPGSATLPLPGVVPDVVTRDGKSVPKGSGGLLVIRKPWPAMARTIFNDPDRYVKQYWSDIPGVYFTGDGARKDEDGYFWMMGRVDDVINVAGHRLGTMEVESALVAHP